MRGTMFGVVLVVVLAAAWGWSGGAPPPADEGAPAAAGLPPAAPAVTAPAGAPTEVDIAAFAALRASGVPVVDVRTREEYDAGHVPGVIHVPLDQLEPDHPALAQLDKGQPVYFICASGRRSARASELMAQAGYRAVNVAGGTMGWVDAGYEVER